MMDWESQLRSALRQVREARKALNKQHEVIEGLRVRGLSSDSAEIVLEWLWEIQRLFEGRYRDLLAEGRRRRAIADGDNPAGREAGH